MPEFQATLKSTSRLRIHSLAPINKDEELLDQAARLSDHASAERRATHLAEAAQRDGQPDAQEHARHLRAWARARVLQVTIAEAIERA